MEKLRAGRVLLFVSLIIRIYRLAQCQDVTTRKMLIDICEDTEWYAFCQRVIPPYPQLFCVPTCPMPWSGNASRTNHTTTTGSTWQYLMQWFKATAVWNGTNIFCDGEIVPKTVIIGGRPKVNLQFANKIMWIGLNQTSSCVVDMPCAVPSVISVDWIPQCADPKACAFQVVKRTNAMTNVRFNSTKAWNNSVVSCNMTTSGLELSEQRILTVYARPMLTSLPADDFFLEGVNVTLSCVTVEYLPPSIDLALHWYCATGCPGDFNKSRPGKITFEGSSAWNGILMKCDSEVDQPIALNTVKRMINVISDVQVVINQESSYTLGGERQLVNCSVIGSYWHIMASHPIELTVLCPGAGCNYITKKIQSGKKSGEKSNEESGEFSVKFVADTTWNGALVICKLRDSFLLKHQARLTVNFTGLRTGLFVLAFCAGAITTFVAVLVQRNFTLVLRWLKCQCFGRPVGPSDDNSDEAHSIHQSQSPTSPGNQCMVAATTLQ